VKTSSDKVVATSFPYLTVHRWIAGDVPIDLKFALKVTHPGHPFIIISSAGLGMTDYPLIGMVRVT